MKLRDIVRIVVLLAISVHGAVVFASPDGSNNSASYHSTVWHQPSPTAWMTQPWTGDDAPYLKIEAVVKARIAKGVTVEDLVREYEKVASVKQNDPEAQYAWAYVTQMQYPNKNPLPHVLDALVYADPKNVHRYTRLRFLLIRETNANGNSSNLKTIGYRLLQRNPKDQAVRTTLIYALRSSKATMNEALANAVDWVKLEPNSPISHVVLASVYSSAFNWSRGHDLVSREKAIQQYQIYLQLAPENDGYRKDAVALIAALKMPQKPW